MCEGDSVRDVICVREELVELVREVVMYIRDPKDLWSS